MTDLTKRARSLADSLASTVTTIVMGDSFEMDMETAERMISDALKGVDREALERAANESPRLPYSWRFLNEDEKAKFMSGANCKKLAIRALIDTPVSEAPVANEQKVQPVLCFEGGTLTLRQSGYGGGNGGGWFAFEEDDLECHPHDEKSGHYYIARVDKSELAALRDWLNANISTPDHVTAPGHTDLMVSPESIDAFMEANPLPEPDPRDAEIERLREVVTACGTQFRDYERQHLAKSPPDVTKAKTNADFAELCETARQTLDREPAGDLPQ